MRENVEDGGLLEEGVKPGSHPLNNVEAHLSASATSDDRSEGPSRKIGRNVLRDLPPPNVVTFHITNLKLREFGFQGIHERSDDIHFDPEIPNSDVGGMNVEGEVLLAVFRDVAFHLYRFVDQLILFLQVPPPRFFPERLSTKCRK